MTRLSVNVNKIASLRNARGGNNPNLIQVVKDCESYGAEGITVHPRPDERHITLNDVYDISKIVKTNYNIEGYPDNRLLKILSQNKLPWFQMHQTLLLLIEAGNHLMIMLY